MTTNQWLKQSAREKGTLISEEAVCSALPTVKWGFTSIESRMRFFGQKFFEADGLTQAIFQTGFFNSDIINLPIVGFL